MVIRQQSPSDAEELAEHHLYFLCMCIISQSVFTSVCCHILADGWGIVLDLGQSNTFPQI